MNKPLIIVESPTKARTIKKFLPPRYVVKASVGHVRDLPKSTLGVDVAHDFEPRYLTIKGKGDVIKDLKNAVKSATDVFLATDPDREGEAIAWHLAELLKLDSPKRIELHEITKEAARHAIENAHAIDMDRVNAQQARRVLDRLVGYKISPLLWSKIRGGLSAGRVQSVAVKLIVDREREIEAFKKEEYWTIGASLAKRAATSAGHPPVFGAELAEIDGVKAAISNAARADQIVADLESAAFAVTSVKQREVRRNAAAPFTTSTLQQEASRKLKFRVRRTMQIAQALYEGIDLGGEGTQGLITYMRTDSTRISDGARAAAKAFVEDQYGAEYYGGRTFKVGEGAQDAHEAIRPTSVTHTPESLAKVLKRDELRLYELIWKRFVASQMASALYDQTNVEIAATPVRGTTKYAFRATGSVLKFAGYTKVYEEGRDDEQNGAESPNGKRSRPLLPPLEQGDPLDERGIEPVQHFTEPPPRFTEATLVKALEEDGIGRPSTYGTIVETIQTRQYVTQTDRRFRPTDIGIAVNDLLAEHFKDIIDEKYTAKMERELDDVEESKRDWVDVLRGFYGPFERALDEAEKKIPKLEIKDEPTDEICPNCGKAMVIKTGRFGRFISCTGYPACKTTKPILKDTGAICPKDGGAIVERKSKRGRTFYGCANYPACDFVSWDRVVKDPCPVCGAYVVAKSRRGATTLECSRDREHDVSALAGSTDEKSEGEREPVEA